MASWDLHAFLPIRLGLRSFFPPELQEGKGWNPAATPEAALPELVKEN